MQLAMQLDTTPTTISLIETRKGFQSTRVVAAILALAEPVAGHKLTASYI